MCGITGFIDFNKKITPQHLTAACRVLQHRGPDDGDVAVFETPEANIGLGHRRLAILDLSPLGHQPMYSDDKSVIIILTIANDGDVVYGVKTKEIGGGCDYAPCCNELGEDKLKS